MVLSFWNLIHTIIPKGDINKYQINAFYAFIICLQYILPCQECREHLQYKLKTTCTIDGCGNTSDEIFQWTVKLHNRVNRDLNKPILSIQDAKKMYNR